MVKNEPAGYLIILEHCIEIWSFVAWTEILHGDNAESERDVTPKDHGSFQGSMEITLLLTISWSRGHKPRSPGRRGD